MSTPKQPLNHQQLRFVEEYLIDPSSGSGAAKRAGYSIKTAGEQSSRLLADERVKHAIKLAQDTRAKALGITTERVLQELALIAFASTSGLTKEDEDGDVTVNFHGLSQQNPNHPTELIVNTTKGGKNKVKSVTVKTVKLADKIAALTAMGKHLGMFTEKVEVSGTMSLLDLVEASMTKETKPAETEEDSSDELVDG